MKRILFTGGNGQLGKELRRFSWPDGWEAVGVDIDDLDLRDTDAIAAKVAEGGWAAVISGGAYTAVDNAERDVVTAWAVNALAPAALAQACRAAAIPMLQVSTDYVFNGRKAGPWDVGDPVAPLGVYGASKLGGELAVATSGARHAIIRTAWVVSAHGNNFVKTMLRIAETKDTLTVVADQFGTPTAAADLAATLAAIAMQLVGDRAAPSGIWHFSNAGRTSWADFAIEIFAQSARRGGPTAQVLPIPTSAYPTPARRPANSELSHSAIQRDYGISPRPWQAALADILDELLGKTI
ncbi:dTDP-4-dehydrorhamnose reductase [Sphingomonas oligophenolica]|uniref:dTDP-4-dehydrorhamnose reductase n=1 Tax=Sphingomonas oligophenolica TaxID=301154 RepID=A0A502CFN7_9SPHN|nr:dTDP-4-dehydrorhamnose reductase [Sphingomonas oligophenolica]TPG10839.1 dTDP-4-dehydrorhamnose reductase [Sphingomonas oligophenolica]